MLLSWLYPCMITLRHTFVWPLFQQGHRGFISSVSQGWMIVPPSSVPSEGSPASLSAIPLLHLSFSSSLFLCCLICTCVRPFLYRTRLWACQRRCCPQNSHMTTRPSRCLCRILEKGSDLRPYIADKDQDLKNPTNFAKYHAHTHKWIWTRTRVLPKRPVPLFQTRKTFSLDVTPHHKRARPTTECRHAT